MLEEKISKLVEKRKQINNSSSFTEISKLWTELKKEHLECKEEAKKILNELDDLNNETSLDFELEENFDFDTSFNQIKEISESVKTCSASDFIKNIKKIADLKRKCLKYLAKEKASIEEVKL